MATYRFEVSSSVHVRLHDVNRGALWSLAMVLASGCLGPTVLTRSLHQVDGQLVESRPVSARSYEAYLRARLALDGEPPAPVVAMEYIEVALRADPHEPQLWTTRAEIELRLGRIDAALASCQRALALRPGYQPAMRVMASLRQPSTASRKTSPMSARHDLHTGRIHR